MEKDEQEIRIRNAPGRCPFCKDEIVDLPRVVACAACGARHHDDCYSEHGACSTCGATQALRSTPETAPAPKRPRPRRQVALHEHPPKGSVIEVDRLDDGRLSYTWPAFPAWIATLWIVVGLISVIGIPLAWRAWQFHRRRSGSRITLGDEVIELHVVGLFSTQTHTCAKSDVGAVRLDRIGLSNTYRLTVDTGIKRVGIGGILSEPEREWLQQRLLTWRSDKRTSHSANKAKD